MSELTLERLEYLAGQFDKLLRLASYPVAVKLFKTKEELAEVRDKKNKPIRLIEDKCLAACQLIGQSRYLGLTKAAVKERASVCMYGSAVLGFEKLPVEYMHGYVRAYFTDEEVAERNFANTPMFEPGSYSAILTAPLEKTPVIPDVVLIFGNVSQIYRIIHAYNYNKGVRLEFSCNGEAGLCADALVLTMQSNKPVVALPCNGSRLVSWPSDDGLACGIPTHMLEEIVEGLQFTHDGMVRYPLTWVHMDWEPPEGSIIRNVMSAKGFFPPDQRHPKK